MVWKAKPLSQNKLTQHILNKDLVSLMQQSTISFSEYGSTEKNVLLNWDASREQMKQDRVCLVQKFSDLLEWKNYFND